MAISSADMMALQGMYENAGALEAKAIADKYKLGKEQIAASLKIASIESKDKRYGIDAQREVGLANIEQARQEMIQIGIPEMEIKRFTAEATKALAEAELALKREEFVAAATGYVSGNPTLEREELARRYGLDLDKMALDRERFAAEKQERDRRFGFDVAQFGAGLASTADTYFQARRFQGVDVPRLMGGAGAPVQQPTGGPTPGIATMGAYMSGQDPYGQATGWQPQAQPTAGAPSALYGGPSVSATPATAQATAAAPAAAQLAAAPNPLGMPGTPEDDRQKQIAAIAKVAPPSPYDGLNEQDAATLKLMESIYKQGGQAIAGGEMERLDASGRMGFLNSAGTLLGYSPTDLKSQYAAYRPAQESSRLG